MDYLVTRPLASAVGSRTILDHEDKPIAAIPERMLATGTGG
jgi:hypothetical protein